MFVISYIYYYNLTFVLLIKHNMYPDDTWKEIEKYHGYSIEPYLSSVNSYVLNVNCQSINEKFRESLRLKTEEEPDFTIERHLYYDDFVKSLQVMTILNTVFLRSADILKVSSGYSLFCFTNM